MSSPPKCTLRVRAPFRRPLFILAICAICSAPFYGQSDDRRIEAIDRIANQINEQIGDSEKIEESNGIYCNELLVNKENKSWPAVGIHRSVIRMYYTFGDREKNPYPNRLLKISITTNRSDRQEYAEYVFNPAEKLIYYLKKLDDQAVNEQRLYFDSNRLIRRTTGGKNVTVSHRFSLAAARMAQREHRKLYQLFLNSLGD